MTLSKIRLITGLLSLFLCTAIIAVAQTIKSYMIIGIEHQHYAYHNEIFVDLDADLSLKMQLLFQLYVHR